MFIWSLSVAQPLQMLSIYLWLVLLYNWLIFYHLGSRNLSFPILCRCVTFLLSKKWLWAMIYEICIYYLLYYLKSLAYVQKCNVSEQGHIVRYKASHSAQCIWNITLYGIFYLMKCRFQFFIIFLYRSFQNVICSNLYGWISCVSARANKFYYETLYIKSIF